MFKCKTGRIHTTTISGMLEVSGSTDSGLQGTSDCSTFYPQMETRGEHTWSSKIQWTNIIVTTTARKFNFNYKAVFSAVNKVIQKTLMNSGTNKTTSIVIIYFSTTAIETTKITTKAKRTIKLACDYETMQLRLPKRKRNVERVGGSFLHCRPQPEVFMYNVFHINLPFFKIQILFRNQFLLSLCHFQRNIVVKINHI